MNSPSHRNAPTFKNLTPKHKHSPVELKEKMRKNYKDKIQNCRNMLLNRFRGAGDTNIENTLTEVYKSLFNFSGEFTFDEEETEILEVVKNELIQEELKWCLEEYEKSHLENYDWSAVEKEDVICPVCQKTNFTLQNNTLSCSFCKINVSSEKRLLDIKKDINDLLEKHSSSCTSTVQFTVIVDANEQHICLICDTCLEMELLI